MTNRPPKKKLPTHTTVRIPTQEEKEAFIKDYDAAVLPIFEKHKLCLVPIVANMSTQYKVHYEAVFAIDVYKSPESKTNESTDSND